MGTAGIRELIFKLEEEAEVRHAHQLRLLEAEIAGRDGQIAGLQRAIAKLKDDFEYNLQLIASRDDELAQYDASVAELQETMRLRDVALSDAQIALAEKVDAYSQLQSKCKELEGQLRQRDKQAADQLTGVVYSGEESLRRQQEQFDRVRYELERKIEEQTRELELQRAEATTAVDDVLRGRDAADDALRAECRAAAAAATSAVARQEAAEKAAAELRTRASTSDSKLREVEAQLAAVTRQAEGYKADTTADIANLKSQLATATSEHENDTRSFAAERQELLVKLQSAEQQVAEQANELKAHEPRLESAMSRLQDSLEAQFKRERAALSGTLDDEARKTAKLAAELADALRDVEELTVAREHAEAESERLTQKIEGLRQEMQEQETERAAEVVAAQSTQAELRNATKALQEQLADVHRANRVAADRFKTELDESARAQHQLTEQLAAATAEAATAAAQAAATEQRLTTELDAARELKADAMKKADENAKQIADNARHISELEARATQEAARRVAAEEQAAEARKQQLPHTPPGLTLRTSVDSPLLPPPSPLGSLPVTPTPGQNGFGDEASDKAAEENAMLRAVVQQMREEMEAMMQTQRAQEEQLKVSMEELRESRESNMKRSSGCADGGDSAAGDGQATIPAAVEARLAALEATVAQREAANERLSNERDKLMEINNRLRHNLTDAVNVATTAAAHHQHHAAVTSPSATAMAAAALPVVARPSRPAASFQHNPTLHHQARGVPAGSWPDAPTFPQQQQQQQEQQQQVERGQVDVGATLSGIEQAMREMMKESRGLRAELSDAQMAVGLTPGSAASAASLAQNDAQGGGEELSAESSGDDETQRLRRREARAARQHGGGPGLGLTGRPAAFVSARHHQQPLPSAGGSTRAQQRRVARSGTESQALARKQEQRMQQRRREQVEAAQRHPVRNFAYQRDDDSFDDE